MHLRVHTRRRLGGLQPLCGIGVTSLMTVTSKPAACSERMAASRPEPGPFTHTSTSRMPCSVAVRAAVSAACPAAKGVPLREPRYPLAPDDAQEMTLPCLSVIVTIVLLNVERMCAMPLGTFLRSRLRGRVPRLGLAKRIASPNVFV